MRPAHGSVSADGVFRISRSFDAIGAIAKTPYDLSLLTESILTPATRARLPKNGYKDSLTGSWEGLRVGILPSTWGGAGPDHKLKWGTSPVVCGSFWKRKSMLTKAQKKVYDGVAEKINEKGGFAVYPIEIPEAVHTNSTLKHNGLSMKDIACKLKFQYKSLYITN